MRFRALLSALREEPLRVLVGEAAWRGLRGLRKVAYRSAGSDGVCPVEFYPMGYYQLNEKSVSAEAHEALISYADAVLAGQYPLLGYGKISLGLRPDWHCDWVSEKSWPLTPSRNMRAIRHDGSDVKAPWELSRLQWSPVVAKAWVLSGDHRYRQVLQALLTDWIVSNPPGYGVNWIVAMEAALRSISLCLTMELLWPFTAAEQPWFTLLNRSLWQHLRFIEAHNEFSYRVRSNHYLSNIVGLTTLSACLRGPGMQPRLRKYAHAVQQELLLQTYADGGDREASTGYHLLVAQMGLHSLVVQQRMNQPPVAAFEARLRLMFDWIATLVDEDWKLPLLGDCDNGRVELLLEDVVQAQQDSRQRHGLKADGLAGLAAHVLRQPGRGDGQDAAWLGGDGASMTPAALPDRQACSLLQDSGIAVLRARNASVVFCAMPNGLGGKGSHTHCDKLSFVLRLGRDEVFCDSGSRGYTRSAEWRNHDRSTRAHNTLSLDEADQNVIPVQPSLLFTSGNQALVSPITVVEGAQAAVQSYHRGFAAYGVEHHRLLDLQEGCLQITDDAVPAGEGGGDGNHLLDLHFILGPEWAIDSEQMAGKMVSCLITGPTQLRLVCEAESQLTLQICSIQISREYGAALPGSSITIRTTAHVPATLRTTVRWN